MASTPSDQNSSPQNPSRLQNQNDSAIKSSSMDNTKEQPSQMEATTAIGESSVPDTSLEKNPNQLSPDSLLISSVLHKLHEQNPSLTDHETEESSEDMSDDDVVRMSENVVKEMDESTKTRVNESESRDGLNVETGTRNDQEIDEDDLPIAFVWNEKRKMAATSSQQKIEETVTLSEKDRPKSTRSSSRIVMKEALVANKVKTYQNKRKRKHVVLEVKTQEEDVLDVSSRSSEENTIKPARKERKRAVRKVKKSCLKTNPQKNADKEKEEVRKPETKDCKTDLEEPGPSQELTQQERKRILRTQKVLSGRVIDPEFSDRPGMTDLVDAIEMQEWSHLFLEWPVPTLHEEEVKDFYCNLRINDDGSMDTVVNDHRIHLTEVILSNILKVKRNGVTSVAQSSASSDFIQEIAKGNTQKKSNVPKKYMKGTFQLFFEFVNKVLLPRSEKRTVATSPDLFLMEKLSNMDDINLAAIMIEHIKKIVTRRDGRHGLAYGYLLGKVIEYNQIPLGAGTKGTIKQAFSLHTLNECECVEEREGKVRKSQTSELLEVQERLRQDLFGLSEIIQQKDMEIAKLKAGMGQKSEAGPSSSSELAALQAENRMLKEENAKLSAQVNELKDKLIQSHENSAAQMSILIQNLTPKP